MPKVGEHKPSGNDNAHLHLLQVELNILSNAAGLCESIAKYVDGHNAEIADKARELSRGLLNFAREKHQDITQPF